MDTKDKTSEIEERTPLSEDFSPESPNYRSRSTRKRILAGLALMVIICAAWIRLVNLESNPPGLWQDEASTGVDAYLIWTTGKDRAGSEWPIISKSFGDYPLAGYRYLTAPIVGIGGLSIKNERLTAAIFGFLMVLICAAMMRRATNARMAFFTLVSAAVCPTWIHFSRYGSEAILLPFFLLLGFTLFEMGKRRPIYFWFGATSLAASAYTYHAVKLVLPLWIIGWLIFQKPLIVKLWRADKKHLFGPGLLFTMLVLPSVWMAITDEGMARGNTVLAWQHFSGWKLIRVILNNYLSYFDFGLLFVRGGPAVAQSIPGAGIWNFIELPFIIMGISRVFVPSKNRRFYAFFFFWFLLGPLPGGVTYESENIGRVIAWLPAPQIFSGIGMHYLYEMWDSKRRVIGENTFFTNVNTIQSRLWAALFCIGWLASYAYIFHLTLVQYPEVTKRDWQFEISAAMKCAKEKRETETIVLSPQFQAVHTFALFHLSDVFEHEAPEKRGWEIGRRRKISPGELYVTPATGARPIGEAVCTIRSKNTPVAYVYKSRPKPDLKTVNDGKPVAKPKFPRRAFPKSSVRTRSITTTKTATPLSPQEQPQKR
ncbi:MAG: hypothetical protein VYC39_14860 [Myxococcota bacterium]|nr:hypothetical protein [Myxococcota bacterium]